MLGVLGVPEVLVGQTGHEQGELEQRAWSNLADSSMHRRRIH